MKKIQLFSLLIVMALGLPQSANAEYYGIKVAGVSVTSDNCDNITGSNICTYSRPGSFEPKYSWVRFDPITKTLTLHYILIERSGSNNRAILNESCDGLTIVFENENYLTARDASPIRLNANTTIKSATGKNGEMQKIYGSIDEDAITIGNGATLTIEDFDAEVYASGSSVFEGNTGTERLIIKNSYIYTRGKYGARNLEALGIQESRLTLKGEAAAAENLQSFSMIGRTMFTTETFFNESTQNFLNRSDNSVATEVTITSYVDINETNFPDTAFRNYVSMNYDDNHDGLLAWQEATDREMDVAEKEIASLQGIEHFPYLERLYCSNNNLTSLDISKLPYLLNLFCDNNQLTSLNLIRDIQCKVLAELQCSRNKLTRLDLSQGIYGVLDCSHNQLTFIDFSHCNEWLWEVKMNGNKIDAFMTETLESLPEGLMHPVSGYNITITSNGANDNVCTPEQAQIAKDKGWNAIIGGVDNEGNIVYGINIGGNMINSANCDDLTVLPNVTKNNDDGYARYESTSGKLCLSGVDIVNEEGEGIKFEKGTPIIELGQEPVNITAKGAGIYYNAGYVNPSTDGLLTITSKEADWYSEKLNIVSQEDNALSVKGKLTLMGVARVEAKSFGSGYPVKLYGDLTLKNDAELRIKPNGNYSLSARGLVLEDDNIVVTPEGGTILYGNGFLTDADGYTVRDKDIVIGKLRNYNYYVAGTRITNANQHAVLGDTTVVFQEPAFLGGKGTIVLNNANIDSGSSAYGIEASKALDIKLIGENNVVTDTRYGIYASGSITIEGPGSLYTRGARYGINSGNKLNIGGDAKVTAEGGRYYGIAATNEATISGAGTVVKAKCSAEGSGAFKASALTLNDGITIDEPEGAQFVDGEIKDADGNVIKDEWVTIMKVNEYDLFIAGERVTDKNKDDVMGDGTISYDPETNTLTLNGANIETETEEGIMAIGAEINIKLEGENNITGRDGLYVVSANIEGPGSLNAKGEYCAIRPTSSLLISGDAQVTAEGISSSSYAISTAYMTISGAETIVSMKGTLGTYSGFAPVLNDGLVIGMPIGAYYNNDTGRIVNAAGEAIKDEWVIIASQDYIDGIDSPAPALSKSKGAYNLAGQLVGSNYKGIIIENGRKVLRK